MYVARGPEREYLDGIIVLFADEEAIFWQGGTRANYDGVSVNSLLYWETINDILTDPELQRVEHYSLGNALNRRISRFKSKFNAELVVNYEVKSALMVLAKKAYQMRRDLPVQVLSSRLLSR